MRDEMIFVIDDDEAVRDSVKVLLDAYGMPVETYPSTEAFSNAYRPCARQCLILDQHLQEMKTGLDFLASPEWAAMRLPVILITGRGDAAIKSRAADLGVSDYIDKPIDAGRLITAIERATGAACPSHP
jgi:two-component system, LuxR family, response regulator FixJ